MNEQEGRTHDRRAHFMRLALAEAKAGAARGEVPVGAVLARCDEVLASAHNECEARSDPTAHAELLCMQRAAASLGGRFDSCTLFVTLEPCAMCAGALINARLPRLVFGASDKSAGCCASVYDLADGALGHRIETWGGILEAECAGLLTDFFRARR